MKTEKRKIGDVGEGLTARFLREHCYEILDRNYRKKWGELDIVAEKGNILHFVEVKSLIVARSQFVNWGYAPEANMRLWKRQRMIRAIKTYLLDKKIPEDQEFQVDIAAVFLDFGTKKARIRFTENVILN